MSFLGNETCGLVLSLFRTEESYHGNYNTITAMREGNVLTLRLAQIIHSTQFTELNFRKNESLCLEGLLLIDTNICSYTVVHEKIILRSKTEI